MTWMRRNMAAMTARTTTMAWPSRRTRNPITAGC
jgi:hypothetical protein